MVTERNILGIGWGERLRQYVTFALYTSVVFFLAAFSVLIFRLVFFGRSVDLISGGAPEAFWGAGLAFLFVRLGEWVNSLRDKQNKRFHSTIRLTQLANDYLNLLSLYEERLRNFIECLIDVADDDRQSINLQFLPPLSVSPDTEAIFDLGHYDLANEMYRIFIKLRSISFNSQELSKTYERSVEMHLGGKNDYASFRLNCKGLLANIQVHQKEVLDAIQKLKHASASARVIAASRAKRLYPFVMLNLGRYAKVHDLQVSNELKIIEQEIQRNSARQKDIQ